MKNNISRRKIILTTGVATSGLLAGCLTDENDNDDNENDEDNNENNDDNENDEERNIESREYNILRGSESDPVRPDYWSKTESYTEETVENYQFSLDYRYEDDDSLFVYIEAESPETNSDIGVLEVNKIDSEKIDIETNIVEGDLDVSLSERTTIKIVVEVLSIESFSEINHSFTDWFGNKGNVSIEQ